jgi:inner membrane protein involved in colicin E2 resistance
MINKNAFIILYPLHLNVKFDKCRVAGGEKTQKTNQTTSPFSVIIMKYLRLVSYKNEIRLAHSLQGTLVRASPDLTISLDDGVHQREHQKRERSCSRLEARE